MMLSTLSPLDVLFTEGTLADPSIDLGVKLRLITLAEYDLSFVEERLRTKSLLPEDLIPDAFLEFRRYIALKLLGHEGYPVPNPAIDTVWHAFLLFTREYQEFCRALKTGFIHHIPHTSQYSKKNATPAVPYQAIYRGYFGRLPKNLGCSSFDEPINDCYISS